MKSPGPGPVAAALRAPRTGTAATLRRAPGPLLLGWLVALLMICGLCRGALADDVAVGMLGLDAVAVPVEQAQAITQALRERLAGVKGIKLIAGKELGEVKLVFGCMDEKPACMAQAGKSLGFERLIYGSVRQPAEGAGVTVALKQLNVKAGQVEKFISDVVPVRVLHAGSTELAQLVQRWLQVLVLGSLRGGLQVTSVPPGAEVVLDGTRVGITPLTLADVAAGAHAVAINLPGYQPMTRTVEVRGGLIHDMAATLAKRGSGGGAKVPAQPQGKQPVVPAPAGAIPKASAEPVGPDSMDALAEGDLEVAPEPARRGGAKLALVEAPRAAAAAASPAAREEAADKRAKRLRVASYFMAGAAAIVGGVTLYSWRTEIGKEDAGRDALKTLQMNAGAVSPDVRDFFSNPVRASGCDAPMDLQLQAKANPVTAAALNNYLNSCQSGRQYADATTGLVATMGSLALLGVVTYVLGSQLGGHDKTVAELRKQPFSYRPRLTVVSPTVTTTGGGVNLSFQF